MTSNDDQYCLFVPEAEQCLNKDTTSTIVDSNGNITPVSPSGGVSRTDIGDYSNWPEWDKMPSPAVSFATEHMIAMIMLAIGINNVWRYKPFDTFYADGDTVFGTTNWWKYANYCLQFGYIAFGGMATLSMIPAYTGNNQGLVSFDMWVWNDYLSYFQQVFMLAFAFLFWGINEARDQKSSSDSATATAATTVYDDMMDNLVYASIGLLAFFYNRARMQSAFAQWHWDILSDADKQQVIENELEDVFFALG